MVDRLSPQKQEFDETDVKCSQNGLRASFAKSVVSCRALKSPGGWGQRLSMATKKIKKKFVQENAGEPKKAKGRMLDELSSRRWAGRGQRLQATGGRLKRRGPAGPVKRRLRPCTYGYDTRNSIKLQQALIGSAKAQTLAPEARFR